MHRNGASQEVFGNRQGLENHAYAFIHSDKDNEFKEILKMKFDVIIGNPPYQLSDGGAGASAAPIYHKFIEQAKKLNPNYLIMITPSRWFAGGKGLDEFRDNMLNDRRIKEIHDFPNSKDCFDNVVIEGGVNYFLWTEKENEYCEVFTYENKNLTSQSKRKLPLKEQGVDVFIRYNQAVSILNKVKKLQESSFSDLVSGRKPFGLASNFKGNPKPYKNRDDNVILYQNGGIGYIGREDIPKNKDLILRHKVYISYAYGMGATEPYQVINNPFYGDINTICTETYLLIGCFKNKEICDNVISYMKTKFFRFLILLIKNTQHGTQKVYQLVPMQDFTQSWTDEKLYQKYGLSKDEIAFIESMIRPMDNDTADKPKKSRSKKTAQSQLDLGDSDE